MSGNDQQQQQQGWFEYLFGSWYGTGATTGDGQAECSSPTLAFKRVLAELGDRLPSLARRAEQRSLTDVKVLARARQLLQWMEDIDGDARQQSVEDFVKCNAELALFARVVDLFVANPSVLAQDEHICEWLREALRILIVDDDDGRLLFAYRQLFDGEDPRTTQTVHAIDS